MKVDYTPFSKIITRARVGEALFFSGYIIWMLWKIIASSMLSPLDGSPVNTICHFGAQALLSLSGILRVKEIIAHWRTVFVVLIVAVACWSSSGESYSFDVALLIVASTGIAFRRIAFVTLSVTVPTVVTIVILSQIGLIEDYIWGIGERERHGLGFLYCNKAGFYLLSSTLVYLYLRSSRATIIECAVIAAVNLVQFKLTDAKNPTILLFGALILFLCLKNQRAARVISHVATSRAFPSIFVAFALLSVLSTVAYNPSNEVWRGLNYVLSNRLEQTQNSLEQYGVGIFADEIEFHGKRLSKDGAIRPIKEAAPDGNYNYIDNSYMKLLIQRGLLPFLLVLALLSRSVWQASKLCDTEACICFFIIAVFAVVDAELTTVIYNGTLFLLWHYALVMPDALFSEAGSGVRLKPAACSGSGKRSSARRLAD